MAIFNDFGDGYWSWDYDYCGAGYDTEEDADDCEEDDYAEAAAIVDDYCYE